MKQARPDHFAGTSVLSSGKASQNAAVAFGERSSCSSATASTPSTFSRILRAAILALLPPDDQRLGALVLSPSEHVEERRAITLDVGEVHRPAVAGQAA